MNSNWKYVPFSDLFDWCQKSNIGSREGKDNGKYPLYIASATEIKRYDEYLESGESLVFGTGGNPCIHFVTGKFAYTNHTEAAKKRNDSICTKFYYYYFQKNRFSLLQSTFVGGGIKNSSKKKIGALLVPIVNTTEQERIVARIEEMFSQLDAGTETLLKTKAQLAVYRQAVLGTAFEGDYPKKQLKDISKAISGYAFKSSMYAEEGKYIVIKIGNVKERRFDFSRDLTKTLESDDSILEKYLLRHGDCIITLTGSRGKRDYGYVAMVGNQDNYLLNQRVAALRFDQSIALPEFYQYYLASPSYRDMFFSYETGNVGQGNVGIKALLEPMVILPDIVTQKRIVERVEAQLSVCDSIEQTVDTALQQAEAMRQSVLKEAFEGRLT